MGEGRATLDITVRAGNGLRMRAALALPDDLGPHRGMVVLHEAFGLNADVRRLTARWADAGYVAVAPDLYSIGNRVRCLTRVIIAGMGGSRDPVVRSIGAAREHLARRNDVDEHRIGVVGYCQGGGFALAVATTGRFGAAACNYGAVPRDRRRLEGACPVVASYGGLDRLLAPHAARLEAHLEALGVPHDIKTYEAAGHSFFSKDNAPAWLARLPLPDPLHAGYDEAAATDGWARSLAFFDAHLGRADDQPPSAGATVVP